MRELCGESPNDTGKTRVGGTLNPVGQLPTATT